MRFVFHVAIVMFVWASAAGANMMPPPKLEPRPAAAPAAQPVPAPKAAPAPAVQPKTLAAPLAVEITRFFGEWRGTARAESETDEEFSSSTRDVSVAIRENDVGGFVLSWSTVQRQKGDPKAPTEVLKSTSIDFIPSSGANRWRSKADADPYRGGIVYWARLERDTLTVSAFTIDPEGRPEQQTYRRKIAGDDMKLDFTNVRDGQIIRIVTGSLKRSKVKAR